MCEGIMVEGGECEGFVCQWVLSSQPPGNKTSSTGTEAPTSACLPSELCGGLQVQLQSHAGGATATP